MEKCRQAATDGASESAIAATANAVALTGIGTTKGYPPFARPFSMSSSTVNGFLLFCDRCIRPS